MLALILMDCVEIQTRVTGELKRKRCFYCLVKTAAAARDEPQSHGTTQMKLLVWEHLCLLTTEHSNGLVTGGRREECERERLTDRDWGFIGKTLKPASTGNSLCSHSDSDRTVLCVGVQQDSRSDLKHTNAVCLVKCTFLRAPAPQRAAALQRSD